MLPRTVIAQARRGAGFSQAQLAVRLGVSRATVGRWERGETPATIDTVRRVVDAWGGPAVVCVHPAAPSAGDPDGVAAPRRDAARRATSETGPGPFPAPAVMRAAMLSGRRVAGPT